MADISLVSWSQRLVHKSRVIGREQKLHGRVSGQRMAESALFAMVASAGGTTFAPANIEAIALRASH